MCQDTSSLEMNNEPSEHMHHSSKKQLENNLKPIELK